ncbi:MAG TPA: tetratricopeptide repeat protein [Kofleriaceae bacterium]|nr:tetratricopeptide repeat protein [Kofleriaceae bacterium]
MATAGLAPRPALAAPKKPAAGPRTAAQKEADRHFKAGVELFKEAKYGEALAEFQRAYDIAPHPLVLYNIAGCHRELSQYGEAVATYNKFLAEGKGKVPAARLAAAQAELDGILARIARVTVHVTPAADAATLSVDGAALDRPEMPLILPPGEHRLVAHADGKRDAEATVRVASGDTLDVELALADLPPPPPAAISAPPPAAAPAPLAAKRRRFTVGVGFADDLRQVGDTGDPSISIGVMIGARLELGLDAILVSYAAVPSLRVRLIGDRLSLHVIGAVPIAHVSGDGASSTFVAGAGGLGLRYRPTPSLAFRLESMVSYAGKAHGTSVPTFLGGELWF